MAWILSKLPVFSSRAMFFPSQLFPWCKNKDWYGCFVLIPFFMKHMFYRPPFETIIIAMLFPWLYFIVFILRYFSYTRIIDTCINLNIPQNNTYLQTSHPSPHAIYEENQTGTIQFPHLLYVRSVWFPFTIIDDFRVWPYPHRLRITGYSHWNMWFYSDVNAVSFNWRYSNRFEILIKVL